MPTGLGDEQLWISATNDNTGTSSAFNDQSGQGNNGTAAGTLVVADTSEGGSYAFDFDGVNDRIDCPSTVLGGSQVFSMSCWVYVDSHDATYGEGFMGQWEGSVSSNQVALVYTGPATSFSGLVTAGGSNYSSTAAGTSPPTGAWHHLASVVDGSNVTLYVDGVSQGATAYSGSISSSPANAFEIGRYKGSSTASDRHCLDGKMDDIRAYTRVLTQSEITHLASQRGVEGPPPVGLGDEQLWWCPTHSQNNYADISDSSHSMVTEGSTVALVADTDAGGQYAGQFAANGSVRVQDQFQFMTTGDVSVSGWIKAATADRVMPCGQQAGGAASSKSGVFIDQYLSENRAGFFDGISNDELTLNGGNTTPNNTWYHVTATKDGTTCKLFVNGVLLTSGTQLGTPSSPDYKDLLIGGVWAGNNSLNLSTGYMDDIRVFDRAITQAEITHLASQRGIEGPPPVGLGDEQLWLCPSLNDSANDISGYGNDGTYNGGMGTIADTSNGGSLAYQFDGTNDRIAFGDTLDSVWTSGSWTISQWIYPEDATYNWFISKYEGGSKSQFITNARNAGNGLRAGAVIYGAANGSINRGFEGTTNLSLNQWYHMVIEYDNSQPSDNQVRVWLDGVEETINIWASAGTVANIQDTAAELRINGLITGNSTFFKPSRNDDIRAYDRALTQSEITHLASQRGVEGPPPAGLGDETLWMCASLNQSSPTSEISGAGLTITEKPSANGTISIVTDTGAGGTHSVEFVSGISTWSLLEVDNFGNTYSEVTSVSWWSRRTAGSSVREIALSNNLWATKSGGRFFYENFNGTDRAWMNNTSGGTNGWINETESSSTWKHHVMVREGVGGKNRLYIDGVLNTQDYDDGGAETTGKDMYFGVGGGSSSGSELYVDDIRTYGRVLTQAEITHLATSRGIEGSPSAPTAQYNAFLTHAFKQLFQTRLR